MRHLAAQDVASAGGLTLRALEEPLISGNATHSAEYRR